MERCSLSARIKFPNRWPGVYEVSPRKDHRGVNLISDALPFGRLWYTKPDDAIEYAKFRSRSHHAVIRVYDDAGNVIEMDKQSSLQMRTATTERDSSSPLTKN
jgi:hypothetical protein